jgi:hypothetical protein
MVGKHEKTFAINLLIDFLMCLVFHVIRIIRRNAVNNDFLIELYSKPILVNGNFLDVITTANFNTSLSDKVLNDDVGHKLSISVSFLVQTMNLTHLDI